MSYLSEKYDDVKMPTERQRKQLCEMLYHALLEIRILGWEGKAQQSADLADAFHNLPTMLWSENFSFKIFRVFLKYYDETYPNSNKYLKMVDKIIAEKEA